MLLLHILCSQSFHRSILAAIARIDDVREENIRLTNNECYSGRSRFGLGDVLSILGAFCSAEGKLLAGDPG